MLVQAPGTRSSTTPAFFFAAAPALLHYMHSSTYDSGNLNQSPPPCSPQKQTQPFTTQIHETQPRPIQLTPPPAWGQQSRNTEISTSSSFALGENMGGGGAGVGRLPRGLTMSYRTGKHCSCNRFTSSRSLGSIDLSTTPSCRRRAKLACKNVVLVELQQGLENFIARARFSLRDGCMTCIKHSVIQDEMDLWVKLLPKMVS